ncbi:hypothetical protein [Pseudoblastomonas halimionae]|uniref:Uncharacterized protein n=1 Tax=Alteriqipengyuania halimionae TaxID=1926630 RepID=A0A6I4U8U3_9SPHN|nr:hypothetical protein [Alteriqipengyuania halimionae]MXP10697.1 hypothetical protein [Alteriqipengyuania halimionae]
METSSKSITQHPLFPAVVTMWFGATFGLCSLVIGRPTMESWVVASGLPQYLSAAQPPLGSTARVLVALLACGIGAVIGLALAAMLVRAKAPADALDIDGTTGAGDEDIAAPLADAEAIDADEGLEPLPALPAPATEVEKHDEAAESDDHDDHFALDDDYAEPVSAEADYGEGYRDDPEPEPEPAPDALAPFLRHDPDDGPRSPFSVFDELGPEVGIGPALKDEADETEDDAGPEQPVTVESDPVADYELEATAEADVEPEPAPPFAGSPPLPSNVHAIDPARMAQNGLPTSFARDDKPASNPAPSPIAASAAPAGQPRPQREDLFELSYLQLTERLAQAIARNPRAPERLRRQRASTAVSGPGIERLREMHARTAPANESRESSQEDRSSGAA